MDTSVFSAGTRKLLVAGDLHGDLKAFREIIRRHEGSPGRGLLLFLGDYADRGSMGIEIVTELSRLLDKQADIVALKGNHEIYTDGVPQFFPCDLIHEAETKFGSWEGFYRDLFSSFLEKLHIAAIINNVLCVHAGISSAIQERADLSRKENEKALLWSDPSDEPGEHPNKRGAGIEFGEDVTEKVLSALQLKMIIRSHQPAKAASGPYSEHGGRVITVNSCSSYGSDWKPFLLKIDTESLQHEAVYL